MKIGKTYIESLSNDEFIPEFKLSDGSYAGMLKLYPGRKLTWIIEPNQLSRWSLKKTKVKYYGLIYLMRKKRRVSPKLFLFKDPERETLLNDLGCTDIQWFDIEVEE